MQVTHAQSGQIYEIADKTDASFLRRKRSLVVIDGENLHYAAKRNFVGKSSRVDFDKTAKMLQNACTIADMYVCASGTSERDIVGGTYNKPWNVIVNPLDTSDLLKRKRELEELGNKVTSDSNADPMIFYTVGRLLPLKRYQVLVIGSGDGDLGCWLAKIVKRQFGNTIEVVTMSLAGSHSPRLFTDQNPNISANIEIGCDLLVPFDQPPALPKPTLWEQVQSMCYNLVN
ncbi:MAG: hypothetical protein LBQ54_15685 [Planctomycetaceae bacterium]|jgi:hypothetical protein|nr:hypothetical protein [Planctomycetaceae bacterium]